VQRLAGEILSSMSCHGKGGWQTWSVFDLSVDVPEEFTLKRSKLMTGRLELEWVRTRDAGLLAWMRRDERLLLSRWSVADMILRNESLLDWAWRTLTTSDKLALWRPWQETEMRGHAAVEAPGLLRDLRRRFWVAVLRRVQPAQAPASTLRAWHCPDSNKLFALGGELSPQNDHVLADVLDSLECH
jgi:hypothetical protein